MGKKVIITLGLIIVVIITAIIGVRLYENRDAFYRFVTDITPDQIVAAQVLYYEPNEKVLRTVDLDKSEYETIADILGEILPNSFRLIPSKNTINNGPYLYIRLADDMAEIMFAQSSKDSALFSVAITSDNSAATKCQYEISISSLSEFVFQKVVTS